MVIKIVYPTHIGRVLSHKYGMHNKKDLFLIPGAWSSLTSFNFLISTFARHEGVGEIHTFPYCSTRESLPNIIARARDALTRIDRNTIVVGHSLGGIIATAISDNDRVRSVLTLSAPLAGLRLNRVLTYFLVFKAPIIDAILEGSPIIRGLHEKRYDVPMTMLVSKTGFNPMISEPNDGIVTVSSQTKWVPKGARVELVDTTHNEILQHSTAVVELARLL